VKQINWGGRNEAWSQEGADIAHERWEKKACESENASFVNDLCYGKSIGNNRAITARRQVGRDQIASQEDNWIVLEYVGKAGECDAAE